MYVKNEYVFQNKQIYKFTYPSTAVILFLSIFYAFIRGSQSLTFFAKRHSIGNHKNYVGY